MSVKQNIESLGKLDNILAKLTVFHDLDIQSLYDLQEEVIDVIKLLVLDAYTSGVFGGIGSEEFNRKLLLLAAKHEVLQNFIEVVEEHKLALTQES